jgi:hypothetical protein
VVNGEAGVLSRRSSIVSAFLFFVYCHPHQLSLGGGFPTSKGYPLVSTTYWMVQVDA